MLGMKNYKTIPRWPLSNRQQLLTEGSEWCAVPVGSRITQETWGTQSHGGPGDPWQTSQRMWQCDISLGSTAVVKMRDHQRAPGSGYGQIAPHSSNWSQQSNQPGIGRPIIPHTGHQDIVWLFICVCNVGHLLLISFDNAYFLWIAYCIFYPFLLRFFVFILLIWRSSSYFLRANSLPGGTIPFILGAKLPEWHTC